MSDRWQLIYMYMGNSFAWWQLMKLVRPNWVRASLAWPVFISDKNFNQLCSTRPVSAEAYAFLAGVRSDTFQPRLSSQIGALDCPRYINFLTLSLSLFFFFFFVFLFLFSFMFFVSVGDHWAKVFCSPLYFPQRSGIRGSWNDSMGAKMIRQ